MTVREYMGAVRSHWVTILIAALLGVLIGGAATVLLPPRYTASTTLYFAVRASNVEGGGFSAYDGNQLAQQRLKLGEGLVRSGRLAQSVIEQVGMTDRTPKQVAEALTATADIDSGLLLVEATDSSPERVVQIANAAGTAVERIGADLDPQSAGSPATVVPRIVDPAYRPAERGPLQLAQPALAGLLAGLLVGIGIAILRGLARPAVRNVAALANITRTRPLGATVNDPAAVRSHPPLHGGAHGMLAESYRRVRTALEAVRLDGVNKVVLVTSPTAGDGRTLMVANLGAAFARAGCKVVVVAADVRSSRMAALFKLAPTVGLVDVLTGSRPLDEVVQSPMVDLDVVVGGTAVADIGDLLGSRAMVELIDQLSATYEIVLIDSPPVLPVADALALAALADGVVLLGRYGARQSDVTAAVEALHGVSAKIFGTVLTRAPAAVAGAVPQPRSSPLPAAAELSRRSTSTAEPTTTALPTVQPSISEQGSTSDDRAGAAANRVASTPTPFRR